MCFAGRRSQVQCLTSPVKDAWHLYMSVTDISRSGRRWYKRPLPEPLEIGCQSGCPWQTDVLTREKAALCVLLAACVLSFTTWAGEKRNTPFPPPFLAYFSFLLGCNLKPFKTLQQEPLKLLIFPSLWWHMLHGSTVSVSICHAQGTQLCS